MGASRTKGERSEFIHNWVALGFDLALPNNRNKGVLPSYIFGMYIRKAKRQCFLAAMKHRGAPGM